jgi:hypothetical protein
MRSGSAGELAQLLQRHRRQMQPPELAGLVNRLAKLGPGAGPPPRRVLQQCMPLVEALAPQLSAAQVANIYWACAKLACAPPPATADALQSHLAARGAALLRAAAPQAVCNLAWALAKLGAGDSGTWAAILACTGDASLQAYPPRDLSSLAYALALAGRHDALAFARLARAAQGKLGDHCAQDLANLAWAFATAQHPNEPLFRGISQAARWGRQRRALPAALARSPCSPCRAAARAAAGRRPARPPCPPAARRCILPGFTDQGLANLLWAFAAAGLHDADLAAAVAGEAAGRMRGLAPQHLSLLAWALAKGRQGDSGFWAGLAQAVELRLWQMSPHELAMALWALASAGPLDPAVQQQVFCRAAPVLEHKLLEQQAPRGAGGRPWEGGGGRGGGGGSSLERQHQDLGNLAWAYSRAGVHDAQLMELLLQLAQRHMASGSGISLAALCQLLSACGTLGHHDGGFLDAACLQLQQPAALAAMAHQSLGTASPALARLNHRDVATWRALAGGMVALAEGSSSWSLSACLWSCAVVGWADSRVFEALFGTLVRHSPSSFDDVCLGQCFQAYLYAQVGAGAARRRQRRSWRSRQPLMRRCIIGAGCCSGAGLAAPPRRPPPAAHRPPRPARPPRRAWAPPSLARWRSSRRPCWRPARATGAPRWRPPAGCPTSSCRWRAPCAPWG